MTSEPVAGSMEPYVVRRGNEIGVAAGGASPWKRTPRHLDEHQGHPPVLWGHHTAEGP